MKWHPANRFRSIPIPFQLIILLLMTSFLAFCQKEDSEPDQEEQAPDGYLSVDYATPQGQVSDWHMGLNLVFSHHSDAFWENSGIIEILKDINCPVLRFPGGAVTSYYHWDDMNGLGWSDSWNPNYDPSSAADPSEYTDLAEFMDICEQVGAEPMVGINMTSGVKFDRIQDGLEEAKALMQHCMDQGYDVKYYYLDNERYHQGWSAELYVREINRYVPELRKIDPDAQFIANWKLNRNDLQYLVTNAGHNFDMLDHHEYYDWGKASWERWKSELPMDISNQWHPEDTPHDEYYQQWLEQFAQWGYPDLQIATNEWNIGPNDEDNYATPFQYALMQSELWLQMAEGGVEMSCFWPIFWAHPDPVEVQNRYLVKTTTKEPNPVTHCFNMLGKSLGNDMYEASISVQAVTGMAVMDDSKARVYIHSKSPESNRLQLILGGTDAAGQATLTTFLQDGQAPARGMVVDTTFSMDQEEVMIEVPAFSLNMLEFTPATGS